MSGKIGGERTSSSVNIQLSRRYSPQKTIRMQKTNRRVIQRPSFLKPDLPGVYQTLVLDPGLMSEVISQTQCGPGRHSETSVKIYDRCSTTT
jgi:hypothetical protein